MARGHDLYKRVKLEHKVADEKLQDDARNLRIVVENTKTRERLTDESDFLINCTSSITGSGQISRMSRNSKGPSMVHTATWKKGYDGRGKRATLVGSRWNASQVLPTLQSTVGRNNTYIGFGYGSRHRSPEISPSNVLQTVTFPSSVRR